MGATGSMPRRHLYGRESELGVEGALFNYIGITADTAVCVERFLPDVNRVGSFLDTSDRWYRERSVLLEVAQAECQTLRELVAYDLRTQDRLVALTTAINASDNPDVPVRLNTRVADTEENTWGSHQNYNVPHRTDPKNPQVSAILASHLVTSSVFSGVGEVVATNSDVRSYDFKVTQKLRRAKNVIASSTTNESAKPIINTREEPHGKHRRLHIISADPTMTPWATAMSFGTTQWVLDFIDTDREALLGHVLKDPLEAAQVVADDLELTETVELANGKRVRPYELQQAFAELALKHAEGYPTSDEQCVVAREWYEACDDAAIDPGILIDRVEWMAKMSRADTCLDDETLTSQESCGRIRRLDKNWGDLSDRYGIARTMTKNGWFRDPFGAVELAATAETRSPLGRADLRSQAIAAVVRNRHKAYPLRKEASVDWTHVSVPGSKVTLADEFGQTTFEKEQLAAFVDALDRL